MSGLFLPSLYIGSITKNFPIGIVIKNVKTKHMSRDFIMLPSLDNENYINQHLEELLLDTQTLKNVLIFYCFGSNAPAGELEVKFSTKSYF